MTTFRLVLICLTALLIASEKYLAPVLERAAELKMQHQLLRELHSRNELPSIQITPDEPTHEHELFRIKPEDRKL